MNSTKLANSQWKIRLAVQRLFKKYRTAPYVFLTEADIQCMLYSELLKDFSGKRPTKTHDTNGYKLKDWDYQALTIPLHAELSTRYRKKTEFVDLSIFDQKDVNFYIKKTKYSRWEKNFFYDRMNWNTKEMIGIEIKFNYWLPQTTQKGKKTKNFKELTQMLTRDLKKLAKYKRGWLILIDYYSIIHNKKEWQKFIEETIRHSNCGCLKKTLNAYYLSPKQKKAITYKGVQAL